jgi:hypothetical protein
VAAIDARDYSRVGETALWKPLIFSHGAAASAGAEGSGRYKRASALAISPPPGPPVEGKKVPEKRKILS